MPPFNSGGQAHGFAARGVDGEKTRLALLVRAGVEDPFAVRREPPPTPGLDPRNGVCLGPIALDAIDPSLLLRLVSGEARRQEPLTVLIHVPVGVVGFPPPLRGRVRVGGNEWRVADTRYPPPRPSPARGEGAIPDTDNR